MRRTPGVGLDPTAPPASRLLHVIDQLSSRPAVAWTLLGADLVWVVFSVVLGFPARLESIFQTVVAAVTVALVFVIQHTQAREQLVTQRKLDELLRALPRADNALIGLEEASDTELAGVHAGTATCARTRSAPTQLTASCRAPGHAGTGDDLIETRWAVVTAHPGAGVAGRSVWAPGRPAQRS